MSLAKKVKTALDETRLLILGAQVLFGFQLNGVFQEGFSDLTRSSKLVFCAGQSLMVLSIALLIAPSMQHRLVEGGEDSNRIHRVTGLYAGCALLPFEISLGIGVYVVFDHLYGQLAAFVMGSVFCLLSGFFWYGLELAINIGVGKSAMREEERPTPLPAKIDQMLTEARVDFARCSSATGLPTHRHTDTAFRRASRARQAAARGRALLCRSRGDLLMTPAALHRISFAGEDTKSFFRLGSGFVVAAPAFLALGIAADLFVATFKSSGSATLAAIATCVSILLLAMFWFVLPLCLRGVRARSRH